MEEIMAIKCNNLTQKLCFLVNLKFQIFPKIIKNSLFSSKSPCVRFVTSLGISFPIPV